MDDEQRIRDLELKNGRLEQELLENKGRLASIRAMALETKESFAARELAVARAKTAALEEDDRRHSARLWNLGIGLAAAVVGALLERLLAGH